ncbi:general amino acid permease AGP2 [Fusarium albosuccineum]|uniref:General amino acid permease AGP2 n=1 Tax=Fusarium albosuccineum TaxID=1237068 RepID=A0A8H4P176_9HYPO|nr:general amino acid permease AGP2 [Fusarium albosuccineum]
MELKKEEESKAAPGDTASLQFASDQDGGSSQLHRRLNNRQIQLIAAGGSIGTALFISIGGALARGGAGNLLLAFTVYSCVLALVNNSIAEMNTYMPVAGGFIRLAGYWVDDAFGVMAGWNFFLYEALIIPFEIVALTSVISFWNTDVLNPGPTAGVCIGVIIAYALINILAVGFYGEAEFWLSGGKLILIFMLFAFTFVTMCGGNPAHDAYGFRHFSSGSFLEYLGTGSTGHFEGFLAALFTASFTIVGPEYISMVAAEAQRPSIYIKNAFKTVYYRFCIFFILGAFTVGIVCAHDDPVLTDIYFGPGGDTGNAASSPYVIAMENLGINGLPHVVNFLIMTSIFSAGNTYTYAATRALYALALEGRAPRFLRYCNSRGIPVWCFCVTMLFSFLSFLQCANGSAEVLGWLVSIVTGGAIINFLVINVTFINYYKACKAQGVDRKTRPYYGYFQPYGAYIALAVQTVIVLTYGYYAFRPKWSTEVFFQNYVMQIIAVVTYGGWKLIKRTRYVRPHEADLVWERPQIEAYENSIKEPPVGFWTEMGQLVGIRRKPKTEAV